MHEEIQFTTRSIVDWPEALTPAAERQKSNYKAGPARTRSDLRKELKHLGARDVFLQMAIKPSEIRLDGTPYAKAKVDHPGIILTYTTDSGTFNWPCDNFRETEANLRAICLCLTRLRQVDDSGVRMNGRQYEGFKALPGPDGVTAPANGTNLVMGPIKAASILLDVLGPDCEFGTDQILNNESVAQTVHRLAASKTHPDTPGGGDREKFEAVTIARQVLRRHHAEK